MTDAPSDHVAAHRGLSRRARIAMIAIVSLALLGGVALTVISLVDCDPVLVGPAACVEQVAVAFADDAGMRGAEHTVRSALGVAAVALEPKAQTYERFRRIPTLGKLIRIEATPAILWAASDGRLTLDQLMINLRGELIVIPKESFGIENPCSNIPTVTSAAPSGSR